MGKETGQKFQIGDTVYCEKFGPMKHQFKGTIGKIYENSALIHFTDFNEKDKIAAGDLHNQAIIGLNDLLDEAKFEKKHLNDSKKSKSKK